MYLYIYIYVYRIVVYVGLDADIDIDTEIDLEMGNVDSLMLRTHTDMSLTSYNMVYTGLRTQHAQCGSFNGLTL